MNPVPYGCFVCNCVAVFLEPGGHNMPFKKGTHLRHLAVMFSCEYPLSPPPLKDKAGQGLSPPCEP